MISDAPPLGAVLSIPTPPVTESDRYFERLPIVRTAETALAILGYKTDRGHWLNLDERIFVFSEDLSAHGNLQTISFLLRLGLTKSSAT